MFIGWKKKTKQKKQKNVRLFRPFTAKLQSALLWKMIPVVFMLYYLFCIEQCSKHNVGIPWHYGQGKS